MILYKKLTTDEIGILKSRYDDFKLKLNKMIINSGYFQNGYLLNPRNNQVSEYKDRFFSNSYYEIPNIYNQYQKIKQHCIAIETNDNTFETYNGWNPIVITVIKKDNIKIIRSLFSSKEQFDFKEEIFTPFNIENVKIKWREDQNLNYYKKFLENSILIREDEKLFLNKLFMVINEFIKEIKDAYSLKSKELTKSKKILIDEFDKDKIGKVDLYDCESLNQLLNKNQKLIIDIDKSFIQKFIKILIYLRTKKSNTQKIFESINEIKKDEDLDKLENLLRNQIHTYNLLLFHSINMVTSLIDNDLITFYEIYECFDQLGVFNSNWENEVSIRLDEIGSKITDLMYAINKMEARIVNSIVNLTYTTQESFKKLTSSVNTQLSSIDSSIKFNNLLTGIQTYQIYSISNSK